MSRLGLKRLNQPGAFNSQAVRIVRIEGCFHKVSREKEFYMGSLRKWGFIRTIRTGGTEIQFELDYRGGSGVHPPAHKHLPPAQHVGALSLPACHYARAAVPGSARQDTCVACKATAADDAGIHPLTTHF
jgi:hypothetical protein